MSNSATLLAVTIASRNASGADRATLVVGGLMTGVLLSAAFEQWQSGASLQSDLTALGAALVCAGWCLKLLWHRRFRGTLGSNRQDHQDHQDRHSRDRRRWSLSIASDGTTRLLDPLTAELIVADVVLAWALGNWIFLRVTAVSKVVCTQSGRDAGQSADCGWLLSRRDVSETDWHGLRRWLVWYRRSGGLGADPI